MALMQVYGELGRIVRLPKRPGFPINNGRFIVVMCFVLSLAESEPAHDGALRSSHRCMGSIW